MVIVCFYCSYNAHTGMTVSVVTTKRIITLEASNHPRTPVLTSNAWVYIFFKTIIFSVCVCVCLSVSACGHAYGSASVHKDLKKTSCSLGWEPPDMGAGKLDFTPLSKPTLPSLSLQFQRLCMGLPASLHL